MRSRGVACAVARSSSKRPVKRRRHNPGVTSEAEDSEPSSAPATTPHTKGKPIKPMKKGASKRMTPEQRAELESLAALRDDAIDTSDAPELLDWSGSKRGLF